MRADPTKRFGGAVCMVICYRPRPGRAGVNVGRYGFNSDNVHPIMGESRFGFSVIVGQVGAAIRAT